MARSIQRSLRTSAFTLLEMVVVIAILVVLAAVITPAVSAYIRDAKAQRIVDLADRLKNAALRFWTDTGVFPIEECLNCAMPGDPNRRQLSMEAPGPGFGGWSGPYIDHPLGPGDAPMPSVLIFLDNTLDSAGSTAGFDLKGNGRILTGPGSKIQFKPCPTDVAQLVNDRLDGPSIPGAWSQTGRVTFIEIGDGVGTLEIFLLRGDP